MINVQGGTRRCGLFNGKASDGAKKLENPMLSGQLSSKIQCVRKTAKSHGPDTSTPSAVVLRPPLESGEKHALGLVGSSDRA